MRNAHGEDTTESDIKTKNTKELDSSEKIRFDNI